MDDLDHLHLYADEPTRVALAQLIKKKDQFESVKKIAFIIRLSILFICFVLLYVAGNMMNIGQFTLQPEFFQSFNFMGVFLMAASLMLVYAVFNHYEKKVKKAETEFQELRKEIVNKSGEFWSGDMWEKRKFVFQYFKKEHDINLYHESK